MEFAYDGGGLAKGGDVTLYVDGDKVGEGRVEHTVPMLFSADETLDLGRDSATPVSDDHGTDNGFTGRVRWVQIDIDEAAEDLDHLISPRSACASRWRVSSGCGRGPAGPPSTSRGPARCRRRLRPRRTWRPDG